MAYQIVQIESDEAGIPEQLGTKEKFWIKRGAEDWLLKFGRPGTGENWAEKAACELARALEIPCAQYELACFGDQQCVISQSIVPEGERLVFGNELLARVSVEYDATLRYEQRRHTVSLVMGYIREARAEPPSEWQHPEIDACGVFLGYLLLDALIGNTDRHHENWGMLVQSPEKVRIAPTFDHASSLGRELADTEREARLLTNDARYSVSGYVAKARSGFYGPVSSGKAAGCVEALRTGVRFAGNATGFWRRRLEALQQADIEKVFAEFPPGWMSATAGKFAVACVSENRRRILNVL
ncbi:MAG: HipA domain-containing protein [Rhodospirillaceae bacterium]|nr:HipA domain-containing protein [Rhodospirillaceae bacterium]MCY4065086.1 HipA domain-containing protein [Rhodospirillaceae bacterium]